jgi:hypothetical protein
VTRDKLPAPRSDLRLEPSQADDQLLSCFGTADGLGPRGQVLGLHGMPAALQLVHLRVRSAEALGKLRAADGGKHPRAGREQSS